MESEFTAHLHQMMLDNMWGVYLCLVIAPFVQEDIAVIGAASLSLMSMGNSALIFILITLGLSSSDLWKYWLGRAARSRRWAAKFATKPAVARAEGLVNDKLGASLMSVRFIPGTRIAFYIAAGYFKAPWLRFVFWIVSSAIIYIGAIFVFFHVAGAIAGEAAQLWLPVVAICLLLGYLFVNWLRQRGGEEIDQPT